MKVSFVRSAVVLTTTGLLLTGCSIFNPYPRTDLLDSVRDKVVNGLAVKIDDNNEFAGDLTKAIYAVEVQRKLYLKELQTRAQTRNWLSGGLISLSALTLFKGISSGSDSDSGRRLIGLAGATAGGLYGIGAYSNNPSAEAMYAEAYVGLTCSLLRTRPWLIEQTVFSQFKDTTLKTLNSRIASAEALQSSYLDDRALKQDLENLQNQITLSKKINKKGDTLVGQVLFAGTLLLDKANLIVGQVNQGVLQAQKGLFDPNAGFAAAQITQNLFMGIKDILHNPRQSGSRLINLV